MGWRNIKLWATQYPHGLLAIVALIAFSILLATSHFVSPLSPIIPSYKKSTSNIDGSKINEAMKLAASLDSNIQESQIFAFDPYLALEDPFNRIKATFHVPSNLKNRTQFWFDIYTKYDSHFHIIHHSRFPWIVYEVVDIRPFLKGKGPKWLRRQRGFDYVKNRRASIRKSLKTLSQRKNFKRLNAQDKHLFEVIRSLGGSPRQVLKSASKYIRTQVGQKDFFVAALESSNKYMHLIENVFDERALPIELTRIPFVESSFNENAQSRVGASGIWQIMPAIGKKLSIVNRFIDERNSPVKASQVAAKILKQNYQILKSWPLAITAYNNGAGKSYLL